MCVANTDGVVYVQVAFNATATESMPCLTSCKQMCESLQGVTKK